MHFARYGDLHSVLLACREKLFHMSAQEVAYFGSQICSGMALDTPQSSLKTSKKRIEKNRKKGGKASGKEEKNRKKGGKASGKVS